MITTYWSAAVTSSGLRRWLPGPRDVAGAAAAGGDPGPLLTEAAAGRGAFTPTPDHPNG
jgi:hypothetical protein